MSEISGTIYWDNNNYRLRVSCGIFGYINLEMLLNLQNGDADSSGLRNRSGMKQSG